MIDEKKYEGQIIIDKVMKMWKDNPAWYTSTIGSEAELVNELYAEVKRLREAIHEMTRDITAEEAGE